MTEKYDHNCVLGTADYLAPEQAVSNQVDIRADIYALGGTFYFMLTGQTPFPDGTIAAKLVAHQDAQKTHGPWSPTRSDVPPGMAPLVVLRTMMAKDPNERYQRPIEVVDALCPSGLTKANHSSACPRNADSIVPSCKPWLGQ